MELFGENSYWLSAAKYFHTNKKLSYMFDWVVNATPSATSKYARMSLSMNIISSESASILMKFFEFVRKIEP